MRYIYIRSDFGRGNTQMLQGFIELTSIYYDLLMLSDLVLEGGRWGRHCKDIEAEDVGGVVPPKSPAIQQ